MCGVARTSPTGGRNISPENACILSARSLSIQCSCQLSFNMEDVAVNRWTRFLEPANAVNDAAYSVPARSRLPTGAASFQTRTRTSCRVSPYGDHRDDPVASDPFEWSELSQAAPPGLEPPGAAAVLPDHANLSNEALLGHLNQLLSTSRSLMQQNSVLQQQLQAAMLGGGAVLPVRPAEGFHVSSTALDMDEDEPDSEPKQFSCFPEHPRVIINKFDPTFRSVAWKWYNTTKSTIMSYHNAVELKGKYDRVSKSGELLHQFRTEASRSWQFSRVYKATASPSSSEVVDASRPYDLDLAWQQMRQRHASECQNFILQHNDKAVSYFLAQLSADTLRADLRSTIDCYATENAIGLNGSYVQFLRIQADLLVDAVLRTEVPKCASKLAEKQKAQAVKSAQLIEAESKFKAMDAQTLQAMLALDECAKLHKRGGKVVREVRVAKHGRLAALIQKHPDLKDHYEISYYEDKQIFAGKEIDASLVSPDKTPKPKKSKGKGKGNSRALPIDNSKRSGGKAQEKRKSKGKGKGKSKSKDKSKGKGKGKGQGKSKSKGKGKGKGKHSS